MEKHNVLIVSPDEIFINQLKFLFAEPEIDTGIVGEIHYFLLQEESDIESDSFVNLVSKKNIDLVIINVNMLVDFINLVSKARILSYSVIILYIFDDSFRKIVYDFAKLGVISNFIFKSFSMAETANKMLFSINYRLREMKFLPTESILERILLSAKSNNYPKAIEVDKIYAENPTTKLGNKIVKSIEFTEEHYEAGVSILTYFSSILRKKYPNQKAKVRIEQDGLKVKMIIHPHEGDKEVIEKALTDYGLVVTGNMPIEEYTDDRLLVMELKQQLRIAKVMIEDKVELIELQRDTIKNNGDLINYQNQTINGLKELLSQALLPQPFNVNVNVPVSSSSQLNMNQNINIDVTNDINLIDNSVQELCNNFARNSDEGQYLSELKNAIDELKSIRSKDELKKSPSMSKVKDFIDNIEKADTMANKIFKTAKSGIDIGKKVAGYYNSIAQWCGLPQVPKPFTSD